MERQGWLKRPRAGGAELFEKAHGGSHRDVDLWRHPCRLVGSIRVGAKPRGRLCLAREQIHARSPEWVTAHRVPASPADHLEQRQNSPNKNLILVCSRTLLVCSEE